MNMDPAVRSVRIAVTLCDRFAELLKGPSTITARKDDGALFGVSGNEEALSLRIGEVQQIYPEIWRHLDEARAAFAARGIDVGGYDRIRATEGVALGAAVEVTHQRFGGGQSAGDAITKSANFNREGHARAVKAADALMRATPDIDWAGIAKAEAEDPNIKAFTRSTTTKRYVMIGLVVAVIAAPFVYVGNTCRQKQNRIDANRERWAEAQKLSDSERRALETEIAKARQTYTSARQAWPAATAPEVLAAHVPSSAPCEYKFVRPTQKAAESFVKYGSIDANYFGKSVFTHFDASERVRDFQLEGALRDLDANREPSRGDLERLRAFPKHVVFVVIDKQVEPVVEPGTTFKPGEIMGRSYVFSVTQQRIVCAGVVDVKTSTTLQTPPQDHEAKQMLERDLEMQVRDALATGLRAI